MNSQKFISVITIAGIFLAGCAHHRDVRPNAGGMHSVDFLAERQQEGYRQAFKQAQNYCAERYGLDPVIFSESSEYVGSMDESAYNRAKTFTNTVSTVGWLGWALASSNRNSDAGAIAFLGGDIANDAIGEGYRFTMNFKCE